MPSASATARTARAAPARVRWDRLGRVAMLGVLVVLAYLYLSAGVHLFNTWREAHGESAKVATMQREHKTLQRQHEALGSPGAVEAQARKLGLMKHGERPFIISNLPNN
jgi:hypothetical protein